MLDDKELASKVRLAERQVRLIEGQPSFWTHVKSGKKYIALGCALDEATLKPLVIYAREDARYIRWSRPMDVFLARFQLDI